MHVERDLNGHSRIFFDNAAGSLVLKSAHAAIARYSQVSSYAGANFADSAIVDELIDQARRAVSDLINAPSTASIFSGESTTAVMHRLAEAIVPTLPSGSNLIVSAADHNANIDPWRHAAEARRDLSIDVRLAPFDPTTGTIDLAELDRLVDDRTRLMAVSHASNVLGAENPIREIRELLNGKSSIPWLIVDGVHFAPHGPVDVQAMGADAYVFSTYKIFGQRGLSFAFGSEALLEISHFKLSPAPNLPPESWEWGFRNPADFSPMIEVANYFRWLGAAVSPPGSNVDDRGLIKLAQQAVRSHEQTLVRAMFDGVEDLPGLRKIPDIILYGLQSPEHYRLKEPTFAFNIKGIDYAEAEQLLWRDFRIALRSGNHYAEVTTEELGIQGSVRASLAHYNTADEIRSFLKAIRVLAQG